MMGTPTTRKTTLIQSSFIQPSMIRRSLMRSLLTAVLLSCLFLAPKFSLGFAQQQTTAQQAGQNSAQKADQSNAQKPSESTGQAYPAEHQPTSIGGELAKETREAEGEEEENANLKHSTMVQKLAKLTGLSVHQAHIVALVVNFAIVVFLIFWLARKFVPGIIRSRNESLQRALQEARAASEDAHKRLADIEDRLKQMDAEIAKMKTSTEKEAESEEARIKKAAEDELGKVVLAAEQEIAAAAKQVRRELSTHTADLALALARKQINVDLNTDQVLVRNFASTLAAEPKDSGGKDGR
jgi:F-type H+-transporting ATPase subunit b